MFSIYFNIAHPEIEDKWLFIRGFENRHIAEGWIKGAESQYAGYNTLLGISFEIREVP